jgi:hypothetical protein
MNRLPKEEGITKVELLVVKGYLQAVADVCSNERRKIFLGRRNSALCAHTMTSSTPPCFAQNKCSMISVAHLLSGEDFHFRCKLRKKICLAKESLSSFIYAFSQVLSCCHIMPK